MIEWDPNGRVIAWNAAAERTFGHSREHALGCQIAALIFDGEGFVSVSTACSTGALSKPVVAANRTGDGRRIMCEWFVTPLEDAAGKTMGMAALAMDVTERMRSEQSHTELQRKLQEVQKLDSLGMLAGGIAHDFNNLLTGILGNASLTERELPQSSVARTYLGSIQEAALRAADLCQQMLAYSGKGRFVVQRVNINALIEDTTRLLEVSIAKNVVIRFALAPKLPGVDADPGQLRQVIMNLVLNASEAIGSKSGVMTLSTGVMRADRSYLTETYLSPDLPEGDYVYLEVADTGQGMTPDVRARIFDPFFSTKFAGRGLGLAVVLGIVRGHGGALKIYTEPGRGTTFKVLLPCADAPAIEYQGHTPVLPAIALAGTALVVDDEETVRTVSARMLESFGMRVIIASDGREAVEIYRQHADSISLVLMDLTMPHMDGETAFREMRRIRPDVRVILMSGFNAQDAREKFAGKKLAGFLQKPFKVDNLAAALRASLQPEEQ